MAGAKITQGLGIEQTTKLSPQQIQMIKLIEVPGLELKERIEQEIQDNPALEEGEEAEDNNNDDLTEQDPNSDNVPDDIDYDDYLNGDDTPDYKLKTNNFSDDDKKESVPFSIGETFHDHLIEQINLRKLSEEDNKIAEYIIGNIDESGYLRRSPDSMANDIEFQTGQEIDVDRINAIIKIVQDLDPVGVGAINMQQCLLIQLNKKQNSPIIELAKNIIENSFEAYYNKHYEAIKKKLGIDNDTLKLADEVIKKLNPRPGASYGNSIETNMQHITPDFSIEYDDNDEPVVVLNNSDIPPLRVSTEYKNMLEDYSKNKEKNSEMRDSVTFIKQKIDSAKWFIEALKQRNNTMYLVMSTIVKLQKEFFIKGDESCMRPLILKDVAEITKLDISTVSRVSNSKYIQTEFGVFPLKYFFSESLRNEEGEDISSTAIKSILKECIDNEDKSNPITDEALMNILKEKGYKIARRTVAKYRERLGIQVARLRKNI